ncbi:cation antiporter [Deinococcus proteolyticus MRP]|uniref:Cation antiporter n=1 Tax=Deinococcus proteolyticus (strain ATCC 35074 / DSM 20540 / JCM 6276 / NBRC 101906 / NCIMB 13154 / VKM Ac-1939 / CCM 2703 / MRP) TaxID=693977 RepID=F0RJ50_DEIPM|nr:MULTISPECIES: Na+/H+ antiporter subunit E [Deinococcus]ADY25458.1 cation antiporter [Deinococcus proteolyticus MRP]MCY1701579.1 Na+/H+ antiporter subunit E [Deinococcus sp. SL84]
MKGLTLNLLVAFVYALLMGDLGMREWLTGFLVGFIILTLFPRALGTELYVARVRAVGRFAWFFVRELTWANVQVALMALQPRPRLTPLIVAVPLRLQDETAQTMLAATITLMPGTVAMGFNAGRTVMYSHAIGIPDPGDARASVTKVEDYLLDIIDPLGHRQARTAADTPSSAQEVRP